MKHIGITGGIGSGKSMVCRLFASLNIPVFNADIEAKKLYTEDETLAELIRSRFGNEIYNNGIFQPKRLAEKVFGFPEELAQLNAWVHPRIRAKAAAWRSRQHADYTLTEAALMMESGSYADYDEIILVEAPLPLRILRIRQRDGVSEAEALKRINAQWSDERRRPLAQHIIYNNELQALIPQVMALHRWWKSS